MAKEKSKIRIILNSMRQPSHFTRDELLGFNETYLQDFITQLSQSITPNGQNEFTIPIQMVSKMQLASNALASREFETMSKDALLKSMPHLS